MSHLGTKDAAALGPYIAVEWWGPVSGYSVFHLVGICVCVTGVDIEGPLLRIQVSFLGRSSTSGILVSTQVYMFPYLAPGPN